MKRVIVALVVILSGAIATLDNVNESVVFAAVKASGKSAAAPASDWEQEWAKTLALAKQEGIVSIACTAWTPATLTGLTKGFKGKYGIDVEFTPHSRGNVMTVKLQEQRRAGLNLTDLAGGGSNTILNTLKPAGLVGSLEPFLILPEVKDPKYWLDGRLPFVDRDKMFFAVLAQKQHYIFYNTNLIKQGEITTYKDLLKPQYKGKITMNDPSLTGPAAAMFAHFANDLWTVDEAKAYLRQLIVDQQTVVQKDVRLQVETVARGKYAIGLGSNMAVIESFLKAGAPIDAAIVAKDGFNVKPAAGGITVLAKPPHPNATKVFLNWFLSKEGMSLFMSIMGGVSTRTDVPIDSVHPLWRFSPGEKLFKETEESVRLEGQLAKVWKQVIEEATK